MTQFEENWNGYRASPINKQAIETAELLINLFTNTPIVTPTGRGTVQLEWETSNGYLELEIYEDKIEILNMDKDNNIIIE
jgi:hypothetical protein